MKVTICVKFQLPITDRGVDQVKSDLSVHIKIEKRKVQVLLHTFIFKNSVYMLGINSYLSLREVQPLQGNTI